MTDEPKYKLTKLFIPTSASWQETMKAALEAAQADRTTEFKIAHGNANSFSSVDPDANLDLNIHRFMRDRTREDEKTGASLDRGRR